MLLCYLTTLLFMGEILEEIKKTKDSEIEFCFATPTSSHVDTGDIKFLILNFSDDFVKNKTQEEIIEMFMSFDWKKMPKVETIKFSNNKSAILAKYIPASVKNVVLSFGCDMHNFSIISENVKYVEIENCREIFYDPTFFERMPLSVEKILLDVEVPFESSSLEFIYKDGFHNLPPYLMYFEILVSYAYEDVRCTDVEELVKKIRDSFTPGPFFKSLETFLRLKN